MKKIFTLFIMLFGLMSSIAAKEITIYFINDVYWKNINAYVWSDKTGEVLPWPGEPVKDTGLTYSVLDGIGDSKIDYKIYSYTFDYNKAQNIIFNYKSEYDSKYYKTEDLKVNPEMSLIYNLKWFDGITYEYNSDKTAKLEFDRDYKRNLEELSEILPNITSIEIPTTVQHNDTSYNVTSIGEEAFYGYSGLTSVTIPNSVTSIGDYAFYGCSGVTSITIPNSVTSIGYSAFSNTGIYNDESNWENGLLYIDNCLVDADSNIEGTCSIKEGTRIIAEEAFRYCRGLTSVTIPNSVTSIGEGTFYGCRGLTSIIIPNSVTSIGNDAFEGCSGLTSITIPNSVTSIGGSAFRYCYGLTSVVWNAKNCSDYNSSFSPICSQITSFTFGNEVEYIPEDLCKGMSKLTEMTIPNSVTSIGDKAFSYCSSLTSVSIPNSVTSIGNYAFSNCSSLTSVSIPNSVIYIGDDAFVSCSGLTSITIPNSVTSIGNYAFASCSSLTSVTIPNSVTSIGKWAFEDCSSLTSVTIPNSVTSIGKEAFYGCSCLTSVTIGNSVTSIGEEAFGDTGIYNNNSNWDNGVLYIDNCLIKAKSDVVKGSYTIKKGTRIIGSSAFDGCSSLTSVTIPNSVTSIGEEAFDNFSLKEITVLPTTVPKVDESAFGVRVVTGFITLYVPCDAYDEYVKNNVFGKFDNIKCISNDKPEENPTSISETIIDANITISGGTISTDPEFHIYNSIGQDVTSLNGNLVPGIYLVQIGEDRVKVMLK